MFEYLHVEYLEARVCNIETYGQSISRKVNAYALKRIFVSPFESPVKRVLDIRNLTRIREYILDLIPFPNKYRTDRGIDEGGDRERKERRGETDRDSLDPPSRSFAHDAPVRAALFESSQWWNKTSTGGSNSTRKPDSPLPSLRSVFSLGESAPLGLFVRSLALSSYRTTLDEQRLRSTYTTFERAAALWRGSPRVSYSPSSRRSSFAIPLRWHSRLLATEAIAFRMTTSS